MGVEFVVIVEKDTQKRILMPLSNILSIVDCENGDTFFETATLDDCSSTGVCSVVKFDEVMSILANKILVNKENK